MPYLINLATWPLIGCLPPFEFFVASNHCWDRKMDPHWNCWRQVFLDNRVKLRLPWRSHHYTNSFSLHKWGGISESQSLKQMQLRLRHKTRYLAFKNLSSQLFKKKKKKNLSLQLGTKSILKFIVLISQELSHKTLFLEFKNLSFQLGTK